MPVEIIRHECNLNGANHLNEMDACPMHLCPVCLRKIHRATQFNPIDRYTAQASFYQKHRFIEELAWTQKRFEKIRRAE